MTIYSSKALRNIGLVLAFTGGVGLASLGLSSCCINHNNPPETYIEAIINEDNTVTWNYRGEDDGRVERIYVKVINKNGESEWFEYSGSTAIRTEPIYSGNNKTRAYAVDNENSESSIEEDTFDIPSEEGARSLIKSILDSHSASYDWYEEDATYGVFGEERHADFLIRKLDGNDAIINYISDVDNLQEELNNAEDLDLLDIDHLEVPEQTESVIDSRVRAFVNSL